MKIVSDEQIGSNIQTIRQEQDITQKKMAQLMHISPSKLAKVEAGERTFRPNELQKAAHILDLKGVDALLYSHNQPRGSLGLTKLSDNNAELCNYSKFKQTIKQLDYKSNGPEVLTLVGPPGSGKKTAVRYTAQTLNIDSYRMPPELILRTDSKEVRANFKQALNQIQSAPPSLLLIDRPQKIFDQPSINADVLRETLRRWLFEQKHQETSTILATTWSCSDPIPNFLIEPNFNPHVFITPLPNQEQKLSLLSLFSQQQNYTINVDNLIQKEKGAFDSATNRFVGAEIKNKIKQAKQKKPDRNNIQTIIEECRGHTAYANRQYEEIENTINWGRCYGVYVD